MKYPTHRLTGVLFLVAFFMDFSLVTSLFGAKLAWPYFILASWGVLLLHFDNSWHNILEVIILVYFLNILLPFYFLGYGLITIIILGMVYYLRNIFLSEELTGVKNIYGFMLIIVIFNFLFFVGQRLENKIIRKDGLQIVEMDWGIEVIKLIIGVAVFYVISKLWPRKEKFTQALK